MPYNTLITEAFELKKKMAQKGLIADGFTYGALVHGCKEKMTQGAKWVITEMLKNGLKSDYYIYSSLIDRLVRVEEIEEAFSVKDKMVTSSIQPNAITYNMLICGVCKKGMVNVIDKFLDEMVRMGHTPYSMAFTSVIEGHCKN
ncbi:hypothetical protein AMTR_s00019p00122420 [Amborella trichopoda]|uniref:Pentacotripeptide-repeat region of PRORP domain-containing protein n=1 Tax=Amborella trichopoda TaxID=13333 RepID=W1PJ43_AMBTC|nr:hypothetical protein AMTR_s00019p00122420 [Amborella trichopoda]